MAKINYVPSTYTPGLDMSGIFPAVDVTTGPDILARPGKRTLTIDWLDEGFQSILNGIRFWSTEVWRGQKFTTMCYTNQGTTSLWMLNLAFNGLDHPLQLQNGMVLRFPAVSEVIRVMSLRTANNGVGTRVSIGPPNVVGQS